MITKRTQYTGRQKAAIFLITLGSDVASQIFKYLREDEVENLVFEMARTDTITSEEREMILNEFNEMMMAQDFITSGGIDYARDVLEQALGTKRAVDVINRLTSNLQTRPFDFVRRTDPQHLLNFIQNEHQQTIALILCYLDTQKAAMILSSLPNRIQADVARRIAMMERVSPEVLREIERVLERKLSTLASEEYSATGGIDAVAEVLNLVDRGTEKTIIEALEEEDIDLAEQIKKKMFVFEDIVLLDDRAIQRVLQEVNNQELAKAMKSVDAEVQEKILKNMSRRASSLLREDMDFMGPVRLKDVEDCQQKIVNVIRKLEETGEVIVARGGEDDLIV